MPAAHRPSCSVHSAHTCNQRKRSEAQRKGNSVGLYFRLMRVNRMGILCAPTSSVGIDNKPYYVRILCRSCGQISMQISLNGNANGHNYGALVVDVLPIQFINCNWWRGEDCNPMNGEANGIPICKYNWVPTGAWLFFLNCRSINHLMQIKAECWRWAFEQRFILLAHFYA